MLKPSLPPLKSSTTRLRLDDPCARARSDRNAGAAKLMVNAATPFFTNVRREIAISGPLPTPISVGLCLYMKRTALEGWSLDELVIGGPQHQVDDAGSLGLELRVG